MVHLSPAYFTPPMKQDHRPIKIAFTIQSIDDQHATLFSEGIGEIKWPSNKLPDGFKEGDTLCLAACKNEDCDHLEHLRGLLQELVN